MASCLLLASALVAFATSAAAASTAPGCSRIGSQRSARAAVVAAVITAASANRVRTDKSRPRHAKVSRPTHEDLLVLAARGCRGLQRQIRRQGAARARRARETAGPADPERTGGLGRGRAAGVHG